MANPEATPTSNEKFKVLPPLNELHVAFEKAVLAMTAVDALVLQLQKIGLPRHADALAGLFGSGSRPAEILADKLRAAMISWVDVVPVQSDADVHSPESFGLDMTDPEDASKWQDTINADPSTVPSSSPKIAAARPMPDYL